jgi:hypothetical protein
LTTLKHGREGKGLATLVSHLHKKINSAVVMETNPPKTCPDLILSPLVPQNQPIKSRKTSPHQSSTETNSTDRPTRSNKKQRESKVLQSCLDSRSDTHPAGARNLQQKKTTTAIATGRSSLAWTSKQQSGQKKKIPFVANDWLFDDTDLSIIRHEKG